MRKTLMLALMLPCAPAFAADYVQAPGSTLTFAGTYQGDVFTGRFPGFTTTFRFDPKQLATGFLELHSVNGPDGENYSRYLLWQTSWWRWNGSARPGPACWCTCRKKGEASA